MQVAGTDLSVVIEMGVRSVRKLAEEARIAGSVLL